MNSRGFPDAAFGEDSVDLLGDANVVEQPEVEVVGLHELEGLFDITKGAVAAALTPFSESSPIAFQIVPLSTVTISE